mgnify:CR=1 FL=1
MNNLPTIDIKGKKYVLVSERVIAFNEIYKNGSIETELISPVESKMIVVKATVTPDVETPLRRFVGHSQAVIGQGMVNTTAALENAETSAVGRALGMMGIGVIESIASADEMNKSLNADRKPSQENCEHLHTTKRQVTKEGISKGKWYVFCDDCKKPVGWTDAPTSDDVVTNENGSKSFGKTEFSEPH